MKDKRYKFDNYLWQKLPEIDIFNDKGVCRNNRRHGLNAKHSWVTDGAKFFMDVEKIVYKCAYCGQMGKATLYYEPESIKLKLADLC